MTKFNSDHKKVLDDLLLGHPEVRPGKMFGSPAYYVNKKLCICLYEEGIGVKLPKPSALGLLETDRNATPFQPMGKRKMPEWVQIILDNSEQYRDYLPILAESIQYAFTHQD